MTENPRRKPPRLSDVDLSLTSPEKTYKRRLPELQHELILLQKARQAEGAKTIIVFEGWDAAGKGGVIRRLMAGLDARGAKVWPIGAPRPYFQDRHYLARFWEKLPAEGDIAVFDRSWYGRVLVERVEGFAEESAWRRAYGEINAFERMLVDDGAILLKFFLHISPEEQLARFRDRLEDPAKRWKLTEDDFRNRARWAEYAAAIDEMLAETSTEAAPWRLVAAEHKRHARLAVLSAVRDHLAEGRPPGPQPLGAGLAEAVKTAFDLSDAALEKLGRREE